MALAAQVPTVLEFQTRFPVFEDNSDAQIQAVIDEAKRDVGDDWVVEDQKPAIMYLTAHLLTTEEGDRAASGEIASESFGPMSTTYRASSTTAQWMSTEYGRRYAQIRRRNVGHGIMVVGGVGD